MDHHCPNHSRRAFLKTSAAAGMAGALSGCFLSEDKDKEPSVAWKDGMQINPSINNLRVAHITDPSMIKSDPSQFTWENQNEAVDADKVAANMDKMAKGLSQKPTSAEAWKTIFQQPAGTTWATAKIAIKVNALKTNNMPKLSIIAKLCKELQALGVVPGNIIIFDSGIKGGLDSGVTPGNNINYYKNAYSLSKLPAGIQVEYNMGGETNVLLKHGGNCPCATWLADGTVDMMINIAVNKGHEQTEMLGGYTLTAKNHVGTMQFGADPVDPRNKIDTLGHPTAERLIAMNISNEILGGTPPKQQLCVVDSLWASKLGPNADPDTRTNSLVMGTFAHAVDYATIKKIRENPALMSGITPIENNVVNRYWQAFGYDPNTLAMDYVDASTLT